MQDIFIQRRQGSAKKNYYISEFILRTAIANKGGGSALKSQPSLRLLLTDFIGGGASS
jgi:hypothetical protein